MPPMLGVTSRRKCQISSRLHDVDLVFTAFRLHVDLSNDVSSMRTKRIEMGKVGLGQSRPVAGVGYKMELVLRPPFDCR